MLATFRCERESYGSSTINKRMQKKAMNKRQPTHRQQEQNHLKRVPRCLLAFLPFVYCRRDPLRIMQGKSYGGGGQQMKGEYNVEF